MNDGIIDEIRQERTARLSYLQAAKDALLHAKFEDVTSDGQDIFNAAIDAQMNQIYELMSSVE